LAHSTVWQILHDAALKPWQYRSWIFPRDPQFAQRAEVVLDLYAGVYGGKPLGANDHVLSLDEKTGLLLRTRLHPTRPPHEGSPGRVEFEYERHGVGVLLAGIDVRSGRVFHRVEPKNGIVPFQTLLSGVIEQEPYRKADRLFLLVDGGGSHHRSTFQARLDEAFPSPDYPRMIAVHLPNHASWLNQIELFFSVVARKALRHFECRSLEEMAEQLGRFIERHNQNPHPFRWSFTKKDLERMILRWEAKGYSLAA
jgi:transposase